MTAFDQLHPALQHHIVNSLGWRTLRLLQEKTILPVLAGNHAIVVAPTAAGKTEATFFPVLSRMLSENWAGPSVLYLCPIKALLNNLEIRLSEYCGLVGRRSAVWHGDVRASEKQSFLREPADCLLTTPESLEVLLVSNRTRKTGLFHNLQVAIIDEIHAFAGDDRGWHVLALLERLTKIAGREIQRIGLSATVGDPTSLLDWLSGHCSGSGVIISPDNRVNTTGDVHLDYVGNLENAALVVSRLFRGEKRLVFCDSRSRAEQLAARLHALQVTTFVSHSSLSVDERRLAENAFNSGSDCAIVATSTLELGVDVGNLDRVIQIDAPTTVSSFLQRMGRTGRRSGCTRNCLFLATSRFALLRAAALIDLWTTGYVEPVEAPPMPFHIYAQQMMALALQEAGIGRYTWQEWIGRMPAFARMSDEDTRDILSHMLANGLFTEDGGLLWFGREGELEFGQKNFFELLSVFQSPPLFSVRHGLTDLGEVHESSFLIRTGNKPVLLLAGRSWVATTIDWAKRVAYVEPSEQQGKSRWLGAGQPLSFRYCQAVMRVLRSTPSSELYSRRAKEEIASACAEFTWLADGETTAIVDRSEGRTYWWTFAGLRANSILAARIREETRKYTSCDNLVIKIDHVVDEPGLADLWRLLREHLPDTPAVADLDRAIDELKFSVCVPRVLAQKMLASRLMDSTALAHILERPVRRILG